MSTFTGLSANNPAKYVGPNVALNTVVTRNRAPTGADFRQPETGKLYPFNTFWLVAKDPTTGVQGDLWYLSKIAANIAYWIKLSGGGSGPLIGFNVPLGVTPIFPDNTGFVTLTSTGNTVAITGSGTSTINLDLAGGAAIQTILGDVGSISGSTVTIFANNAANQSGGSVEFVNSGTVSTLHLSDINHNVYLGQFAGNNTLAGAENTAVGLGALNLIANGSENIAIGNGALASLSGTGGSTASGNVAFGWESLVQIQTGSNNIAIGINAGAGYTLADSNNINIGTSGGPGENNTIRIGNQGVGPANPVACYIAGITGVTVANQELVTIDSVSGQLGVIASSDIATNYVTDSGTAVPSGGIINVVGTGTTTTFGAGNTITITSSGGGAGTGGVTSVITQSFTSSGTYTPTAGMAYAQFELMGGGGGGGGVAITTSVYAAGGGGGGGEYASGVLSAATIGVSQAITIGAGGAGGAIGNNPGNAGGTTSLGGLITALGGGGGSGGPAGTSRINPGSFGGTGGIGGTLRFQGDWGGWGQVGTGTGQVSGGIGGGGRFSGGVDQNLIFAGAGAVFSAGKNGIGYGGGGSGAAAFSQATGFAGGNGSDGLVLVTEYIASNAITFQTGTFVPTLTFGGLSTGITYGARVANYTILGNVLYFSAFLSLTNKGSATGIAAMGGLPVANIITTDMFLNIDQINVPANLDQYLGIMAPGTSVTFAFYTGSAPVTNTPVFDNTFFTNTSFFRLWGYYFIS